MTDQPPTPPEPRLTPDDVVDLLSVAAAFDRRTIGRGDVVAWHTAIGDLDPDDARDAIVDHYRRSTDFVMPAHVRDGVAAMRAARFEAAGGPTEIEKSLVADGVDPDDHVTWLEEYRRRRHAAHERPSAELAAAIARHPSNHDRAEVDRG